MQNHDSRNKRQLSVRARTVLACGLLAFLVLQMGYTLVVSGSLDPEYDIKLAKLRERLAEEPHRPLILILGSSRSAVGIRPEELQPTLTGDHSPLVFNFGMIAMGPRQQLVLLRRLLALGIHPEGVLIELFPPKLSQLEDADIKRRHMQAEELAIHQSGPAQAAQLHLMSFSEWLDLHYSSRIRLLRRYAPTWVESETPHQDPWKHLNAWGWWPYANGAKVANADQYRNAVNQMRLGHGKRLTQWKISDVNDRALQEILKTCQRERMSAALYLMPEGSPYRQLYPPAVRVNVANYLTHVCRDYNVALLDATLWSADEDFWDGHHLLCDGATRFSQRFGRELLDPFVTKLNSPRVLSQRPMNDRH